MTVTIAGWKRRRNIVGSAFSVIDIAVAIGMFYAGGLDVLFPYLVGHVLATVGLVANISHEKEQGRLRFERVDVNG